MLFSVDSVEAKEHPRVYYSCNCNCGPLSLRFTSVGKHRAYLHGYTVFTCCVLGYGLQVRKNNLPEFINHCQNPW